MYLSKFIVIHKILSFQCLYPISFDFVHSYQTFSEVLKIKRSGINMKIIRNRKTGRIWEVGVMDSLGIEKTSNTILEKA